MVNSGEPVYGVHDLRQGSPVSPKDIAVDLVAVHGLGGHAYNTWTHSGTGTFWLRDLLPDRLPGVRTLVFGFNARKKNHNAELDFEDVATQLIAGMGHFRAQEDAVTLATQQAASIASCTKGFVFFATPHCGSSIADLAVSVERISKVLVDPPNNFLRGLCTVSPALLELDASFKNLLQKKSIIPCVSFYEGNKKKGFFKNSIVVSKESALLHVDNEEATCLNADHTNIVKFKNANDDNFKIVLSKLRALVEKIKNAPREPKKRRNSHVHVPFMPGKYFVGRVDELAQLHDWLGAEGKYEPKTVALFGLGGVGKTQLALKYAVDHAHVYDWVFFANAASPGVLRNDFKQIQHSVIGTISKEESFVDKILAWLASCNDRWLLILDNANHLPDVAHYISRLVHSGHIIVTTQDGRVDDHEFISSSLQVQTLKPQEAQDLLFARAGLESPQQEDVEVAKTLLDDMGHLPLAIDSAGAYINVRRKSVTEYASLFQKFQKDILDHRPKASSYDRSVMGTLELNLKEIDAKPDAHALLCLLIFLDRAEVTEEFLKRGVTEQLVWGPNGEILKSQPWESYVAEELVELINNDFKFDAALEDLISYSIITFRNRNGTGRAFSLHPLYHKCAKLRMSRDQRQKYSARALMFLAHAYPSDEYVLENGDGVLGRSYIPHINYAYESFRHPLNALSVEFLDSLASSEDATGRPRPRELVAKLVLDGDLTYGQGDTTKNAYLLAWVDELLKSSISDMGLKARALIIRLGITYYEAGDYTGGVQACQEFLTSVKEAQSAGKTCIDELTNAELGVIQSTLAELLVTEVSVAENFEKSKAVLKAWFPLNPNQPSSKEKITLGTQARILGKLLKDHGDWAESEAQFIVFLDTYAVRGSQTEGWSAGDLSHCLMEQARPVEAEQVLRRYLMPRQIFQSAEMRARDRRSDTMYLELLLGESLMLQSRYDEAENTCQALLRHFYNFDKLWHFERFRVAFLMTTLARLRHWRGQYYEAIEYWEKIFNYCVEELDVGNQKGKWNRGSFVPLVAVLSMSDCYFELGQEDQAAQLQAQALELLDSSDAQPWILGLGTYWLGWLRTKARKRQE
ncbi:hypothetical protein QQS21_011997 [Conoideocrella luteorostrata]|uniref:NB-ARC domain-containing protein n=1 Tax=Conoideocrella luteorostrata TaxID=1105319 RepID=A0AAJ0FMT8_9HYPO|nr:hypothetical protein QQS21_011997 [Conoideocrella luteorostrata]